MLGALVRDLVGDQADVHVLMPDGVDPHEYRPSAKDVESVERANVVVANGLGVEEGLDRALDRVTKRGGAVFTVTDHVALRSLGADPAGSDPHVWLDPLLMSDAMAALTPFLSEHLDVHLGDQGAAQRHRLEALDSEVRQILAAIPADRRLLVTGHESLGYFADRYDLRVVGALVPAASSEAAPGAKARSGLEAKIRDLGVPVVFNEVGTPPALAEAVGRDTGVPVVEISTHSLGSDGRYSTFMLNLAGDLRDGLVPR